MWTDKNQSEMRFCHPAVSDLTFCSQGQYEWADFFSNHPDTEGGLV